MGFLKAAWRRLAVYGRPAHWWLIRRNRGLIEPVGVDPIRRLDSAMRWLCRAQDASQEGGVAGAYTLASGWLPPYPETTGYIIETFLSYADWTGDAGFAERALRMGDWEIGIQLESGAVRGGVGINEHPVVFNTGQVMLGWNALFRRTGEQRFLDAAHRAARWLVSIQDDDGKWSRHTYLDHPNTYHARVAWLLLETAQLAGDSEAHAAGIRFLEWALMKSAPNGWFRSMGFREEEHPLTHTIAYTLRGLWESAAFADPDLAGRIRSIVTVAAENLLFAYERRKPDPYAWPYPFAARFDSEWRAQATYSCLTGNCQIAILWLKVYRHTGDARFLNAALKIIDQTAVTQVDGAADGITGGIAGSWPIGGGYMPYAFPNWAAKFFADSVMEAETAMRELEGGC